MEIQVLEELLESEDMGIVINQVYFSVIQFLKIKNINILCYDLTCNLYKPCWAIVKLANTVLPGMDIEALSVYWSYSLVSLDETPGLPPGGFYFI